MSIAHRTIKQKIEAEFKDRYGHKCYCGKRIYRRNIAYYRNEWNELKPICRDCAKVIEPYLEVVR